MYKKVSTDLNFVDREKAIEKFWQENHIFEKSMEEREGNELYMFYDGPPTANGKPHIGHVLTRVIKDMIPRYRTMKGYEVPRKAGWDTHGLPVELEVEKALGLDGKEQIEEFIESHMTDEVMDASKLVIRDGEDFEKLILAYDYSTRKNSRYAILEDEPELVEQNGYRYPALRFVRRGV